MKIPLISIILSLGLCACLHGADRPNILWITTEDNAWNWLGCYGNPQAQTPRLDALAASGTRFTHAYSNAPVCAVARSTILNGAYAVSQGTQHMRSRHAIPHKYRSYVSYLRDAGYYCTNHFKTDYNFKGDDNAIWNECSKKAHYNHCPKDQPFFAIFNLMVSHESSLFAPKILENRKNGTIPHQPRIHLNNITVPPYLPDLPEVRSDIAIYHDTITAMDSQIGQILDELKASGHADDTIVFYYSDHGGILPRGKRYLYDTGVRVPMILHIPEKWAKLSPFGAGRSTDELVSFVDLAPTLLSLAGIDQPSQMQGRAFLGPKRVEPNKEARVFLYADRFDELYGMRRGITDGRWKYIRCFSPYRPAAPYSDYSFGQAAWRAWQKAWNDGNLSPQFGQLWESPQPVERLFDTTNDPWEIHNLATDPAHADQLKSLREQLKQTMIQSLDLGIIPEPMFDELAPNQAIADFAEARQAELPSIFELAFAATSLDPSHLPTLTAALASENPLARYWASQGCFILGSAATPAKTALSERLKDPFSAIRVSAAHALAQLNDPRGQAALISELERDISHDAILNALNTLSLVGSINAIPPSSLARIRSTHPHSDSLIRLLRKFTPISSNP